MKSKLSIFLIIVLIICVSILLRVILPFNDIFTNEGIKFTEVDSYYYMKLADYSYNNFPNTQLNDPLINYVPYLNIEKVFSQSLVADVKQPYPILSLMIAFISIVTNIPLDIVGAYFPAVLGLLMIIPVFVICSILFSKWVAIFSTFLFTIMPGELLSRTSLGYMDTHCIEIFLTLTILMFLILAVKKHWTFSIGSGLFWGIFYLVWNGSIIFSGVIILWVIVQNIIYHINKSEDRIKLNLSATLTSAIAFLIYITVNNQAISYVILYGIVVLVLFLIFILAETIGKFNVWYFILAILGVGAVSLTAIYLVKTDLVLSILKNLSVFDNGKTVSGMQSLTIQSAWSYYGVTFVAGIVGAVYFFIKNRGKPENTLIFVWFLICLTMSIMWVRFSYYLAIPLSIFTGFLCFEAFKLKIEPVRKFMLGCMVLAFIIVPLSVYSVKIANYHPFRVSTPMTESLTWLKSQTGEFKGQPIYSVLTLWDYGYWIAREGNKAVVSSPTGNDLQKTTAEMLNSVEIPVNELNRYNVKFIMVTKEMVSDKYQTIAYLSGHYDLKDSFIYKLWNEQTKFKKVFENTLKYGRTPEVKIFEY